MHLEAMNSLNNGNFAKFLKIPFPLRISSTVCTLLAAFDWWISKFPIQNSNHKP